MATGKILNLGGMDNRPPKTNQTMGRFRVARNVMPTPDDTLIPRYDWGVPGSQPTQVKGYYHIANYDNEPLSIIGHDPLNAGWESVVTRCMRGTTIVPQNTVLLSNALETLGKDTNSTTMSYRRKNTTFFLAPYNGSLMKYDGEEFGLAGCAQPIFSIPTANVGTARWVNAVQHSIDFDMNYVTSELVQVTTTAATLPVQLTNLDPALYTLVPSNTAGVDPQSRIVTPVTPNYFTGTTTYNAGNNDFPLNIVAGFETNITGDERIGSYVIVACTKAEMTAMGFTAASPVYYGLALKVKAVSPSLKLDALDAYLYKSTGEWEKRDLTVAECGALDGLITYGSRTFMSFWESTSATGIFHFRAIHPSFPGSASTTTTAPWNRTIATTGGAMVATAGADQTIFSISPLLNDWYDTTSVKIDPNSPSDFSGGFYGMTTYQDALLLYNTDLIYFSDSTLGGAFEQLEASSFIKVGDKEHGRITSVCGNNDFFVVFRERKIYYVTGNIFTGNYKVQELPDTEVGAWNNTASISVKDSVVFVSSVGVFQILSGGRVAPLSDKIPKNFARYNNNNVNEDVSFVMSNFTSDFENVATDGIMMAYDAYRSLLLIMQRGTTANASLLLSTKTWEFYEWDGLYTGFANTVANCVQFINASYYLGPQSSALTGYNVSYAVENSALIPTYMITYPIKLYTTWLTAGEPSLEKEILQLKFFGRVKTNGTNHLKVRHYKDWDISTLITDTTYDPILASASLDTQVQYSHKKRLNSDKCLAASVGVEITQYTVNFEIESFEVEFNPIQSGMKR